MRLIEVRKTIRDSALRLRLAVLIMLIAGCSGDPTTTSVMPSSNEPALEAGPAAGPVEMALQAGPQAAYAYTYHRPDGNRLVAGTGRLPEFEPLQIPLAGAPVWLAAASGQTGSVWAAVLEGGQVQAFQVHADGYAAIPITPDTVPPGAPPVLVVDAGQASLLVPPGDASLLSHPVPLPAGGGRMAYIAQNGDLVLWGQGEVGRLAVDALPDARILVDESERLLLLAGPTESYDHAVLGDALEASRILLVETAPELRLMGEILMRNADVIEGIAPIWADLDGDGKREIIVTISNRVEGAGLVVYREDGSILTEGLPIGQGYRWRNQLAVAPTSPDGALELINVVTPHISGLVEFLRFDGSGLEITARVPGYTSHVLGTRNLDMALAGDFDADGLAEVLLPSTARTELAAIRRSGQRADPVWSLPLDGTLATNLAAAELAGGDIALGAGTQEGSLFIWHP